MSALRFAIIGCGLIGRKRCKALPKGALAVACDLIPERAASLIQECGSGRATQDVSDAINDPMVDAVIVSTLNSTLAEISAQALAAGKHVLVEKPAATSTTDIDRLSAMAEEKRRCVRVGFNHRYHPALLKTRELVEDGEIGPLMFLRARYGHGGRVGYEREWRADPNLSGGGELIDQGVHLIDLAGWFLGEFTKTEGHAATYFWDMRVDDNAFLSLRNNTGATAWLHVSCTEWKNLFSMEIYGRTGKLQIDGLGGSYGPERLTFYKMLPEMGPPETNSWEFPGSDESWQIETAAFMEDIRLQRTPVPGLKEAKATLEVVEAIYQSSGYPLGKA